MDSFVKRGRGDIEEDYQRASAHKSQFRVNFWGRDDSSPWAEGRGAHGWSPHHLVIL